MQKKQLIARKPAYRHGQLLLEDDFIDEQQFHAEARYRHAAHLHGFGVVRGLEVTHAGEGAVSVSKGYAVDRKGREIELKEPETLELHGLPPGSLAWVTLGWRTEPAHPGAGAENRIDCYAVLRVATGVEPFDVRLASVQVDERGLIAPGGIHHHERDRLASVIAPGSVTPEALDAQLRRDWVTVSFHPSAIPRDESDTQPAFRIGATEAQAHREIGGQPNERGAAGTMPLVLPPGIRFVHRLRVAGAANEKKLVVRLLKGGFDPKTMKHARDELIELEIGPGAYFETVDVPAAHQGLADRHRTLSVDLRAEGYVRVSLVAVEVSY